MLGGLLVGIRYGYQPWFAPSITKNLQACGQLLPTFFDPAHRHCDSRETGLRRQHLAVIPTRGAQISDEPRHISPRWVNKCVELFIGENAPNLLGEEPPIASLLGAATVGVLKTFLKAAP